ncbi:MAG: hypothetical protein M1831_006490 [Alyxoria varia]|nr:MAG: hypothetical protein M1831_006490 [Alyxoria varia]
MILRSSSLALGATLLLTILPSPSLSLSPTDIPSDLPVSKILSLAQTSLTTGSSQDALAYYDIAITRDPRNYLTFFKRGATYLSIGRPTQALADFDKVLTIKPGFEGALTQRAKIKSRVADWKAARADYEAAGKGAKSVEVTGLVEAEKAADEAKKAFRKRNWEECVTKSSEAIMTATGSMELRKLRTKCRLEKGEILEALGDLQQVLQLNPGAEEPPMQISAMQFYSLGELQKGLETVKKCLHSDPDSKTCKRLFKKQKRLEKSLKKVRELMEKRSFAQAVKLLVPQGEDDQGLIETMKEDMKEYRTEHVIHPKAPEELLAQVLEMTCDAYLEMNNAKRAQPYCTDALSHNPDSLPGLLHKAQAQISADDFESAIRTLQHAQSNSPGGQNSQRLSSLLQKAQGLLKRSKTKDYYKVLELERGASEKDIKKAYRRMSKKYHPDKAASPEARPAAEKKMASINEAYEVLKDPELKARFDAGEDPNDPAAGQGGGGPGGGGGNPFAGFGGGGEQFVFQGNPFGGGGGGQQFVFRQGGGGGGGGGQRRGGGQQQGGFKFPGGGFPFG